jgi:hypothetical protein
VIRVLLDSALQERAREMAEARMNPARHYSRTRKGQRRLSTQLVGATGEVAVTVWLKKSGIRFDDAGLVSDDTDLTDVLLQKRGIEVMTAQSRHRDMTQRYAFGYAVPDNKYRAHLMRSAWGYLFVDVPAVESSDDPDPIPFADIAYAAPIELVGAAPVQDDDFRNRRLDPSDLLAPEDLLRLLSD